MPATPNKLTIDPQGLSVTVDILDVYAVSQTTYTASGGASTHTLPLAISGVTDFFLTNSGVFTVSAKFAGVEIANTTITVGAGVPAVYRVQPLTVANLASLLADRANIATAPTTYTQTYSTADATVAVPTAGALTDSTTGTASSTLAAGVGVSTITFSVPALLAFGTGGVDLVTAYVPGFKFKVLGWDFTTNIPGTGVGASLVFNMEIGATDVGTTPSTCTVNLAGTSDMGERTAGTAVAGANTGSASDTFSIEAAAAGSAFTTGAGEFHVKIQNMDTADAFASYVVEQAKIVADDLDNRKTISQIIDDLQACGLAG